MTGLDRLPPHNLEAEQAFIGSLLADRDAIALVSETVSPDAFFHGANGVIYRAMLALWKVRRPCDLVTLADLLQSRGLLESAGGIGYLSQLLTAVPSAVHVEHYGGIVTEHARRRALINAGAKIVSLGYREELDLEDALGEARAALTGALNESTPATGRTYETAVASFVDEMERRWDDPASGADVVKTQFHALDRALNGAGGFERGQLVVIGARPSMGKTAFMLQLAHNAARRELHQSADPRWTMIFSSEMTLTALLWRALAEVTEIPVAELKTGIRLSGAEKQRVRDHARVMANLPIWIDDTSRPTTAQMQSRVERFMVDRPVRLVMFDYIEQAGNQAGKTGSEEQRVAKISSDLKHLAKTTETTVVALSQLNRGVELRENKRPRLADLRQSGMIEQDADIVMFLYRDEYYTARGEGTPDPAKAGQCDVILAKQRDGETGTFTLRFEPSLTAFKELDA